MFEQAGVGFSDVSGTTLPASATAHRPELAGAPWRARGRVAGDAPAQSARADQPCQRALSSRRSPPSGEPIWWFGGGFDLTPFYPCDEDVLHWHRVARDLCAPFGERPLCRAQGLVRSLFLPEAPQRGARRRRAVLRRPSRADFERVLRLPARGRRWLPRRLPADRRAPPRHAVRRARARVPAVPARPLRGVQPGLGPGHPVRPAVGRAHRKHPDEPAAAGPLRIRLPARARQRRRPALQATTWRRRDWLADADRQMSGQ